MKEYLGFGEIVAGIVTKDINSVKAIVTSVDMVQFSEATVETVVKSEKTYILLTEKL